MFSTMVQSMGLLPEITSTTVKRMAHNVR